VAALGQVMAYESPLQHLYSGSVWQNANPGPNSAPQQDKPSAPLPVQFNPTPGQVLLSLIVAVTCSEGEPQLGRPASLTSQVAALGQVMAYESPLQHLYSGSVWQNANPGPNSAPQQDKPSAPLPVQFNPTPGQVLLSLTGAENCSPQQLSPSGHIVLPVQTDASESASTQKPDWPLVALQQHTSESLHVVKPHDPMTPLICMASRAEKQAMVCEIGR